MILRTKLLVILFTVPLYLINDCNGDITDDNMNDDSDEDEDDKLKQALILVDLLKAEYLRVLHENSILRNGVDVEVTTPVPVEEQSTCAPTGAGADADDANENITTYSPTSIHDTNGTLAESPPPRSDPSLPEHLPPSSSPSSSTPRPTPAPPVLALSHAPLFFATRQPLDMPVPQNQQHPFGSYYRRRIPAEYYYYDVPFPMRRNLNRPGRMYDDTPYNFRRSYTDGTGPNKMRRFDYPDPITSDTDKPTTQTTTILTEPVGSSTGSKMKQTKSDSKPSATRKHASAVLTTATKRTRSHASPEKVRIPVSGSSNSSTKVLGRNIKHSTKDPVMAQIASELISELKEDVPSLREGGNSDGKAYNAKHGAASAPAQNELVFLKPKTTLRIHLAHSTRYPLPLPENHAFCYYSPKNPLCSTFV